MSAEKLQDHLFVVDGGHQVVDGKSTWPDLVRVAIPRDQGLEIAMNILTSVRNAREDATMLFELPLFGRLERLDEDGKIMPDSKADKPAQ
jgi:hypothetical protein